MADLFWEKKNLDYVSRYQDWMGDQVDSRAIYNKRSAGINTHYLKAWNRLSAAGGLDWLTGSIRATQSDVTSTAGDPVTSYSFWSGSQDQYDAWGAVTLDPVANAPWVKGFSGELMILGHAPGVAYARWWMDKGLKK